MKRAAALGLLLSLSPVPLWADDPEHRGDGAFRHRVAGFLDRGAPMPEPTETAIAAYGEALAREPESLRLHDKLIAALYFQGRYLVEDEMARRRIYERLVELASPAGVADSAHVR